MKQPHLAGGEDGTLYLIKFMTRNDISPRLPYRLYLRRHNGYKFKKGFKTEEEAMWFVELYLRLCCIPCKAAGTLQKVSDVGGIRDGFSNFPHSLKWVPLASGQRSAQHKGACLNCKTIHEGYYDGHVKKLRPIGGTDAVQELTQ